MRKLFTAILFVMFAVVIFTAGYLRCNMIYLPGTTINGEDVSWQSKLDFWNNYLQDLPSIVVVKVDDTEYPVTLLSYTEPAVLTTNLKEYFSRAPITFEVTPILKEGFILTLLEKNNTQSKDASLVLNSNNKWELVPEVYGWDIDSDEVYSDLMSGKTYIDLDKYKVIPDVTAENLQEKYDSVSWMNEFEIKYTDGTSIEGSDLLPMVDGTTYELNVDEKVIKDLISPMSEFYDTRKDVYVFKPTSSDASIEIKRGKWSTLGKQLNLNKEVEYVMECIKERKSEINRTPCLTGYDDLTGTYVEVSIQEQHAWYYKDGTLVLESPVVTGTLGSHDTPTGVYYMSECLRDVTLRGPGYASFVSYWMRLTNSGIGLHDATWRNKFGNKIYTYSGSHGCINLPKSFAKELFKDSYVGMPVVIY